MEPLKDNRPQFDDFGQPMNGPSPHFRISQLEGAIMGAIPYFEKAITEWADTDRHFCGSYDSAQIDDARKVIANLKALIN